MCFRQNSLDSFVRSSWSSLSLHCLIRPCRLWVVGIDLDQSQLKLPPMPSLFRKSECHLAYSLCSCCFSIMRNLLLDHEQIMIPMVREETTSRPASRRTSKENRHSLKAHYVIVSSSPKILLLSKIGIGVSPEAAETSSKGGRY